MFPDQQNQNSGQPQGPYQQPAGPAPGPQQAANGQYEVLPPLPVGQNTGHSGHNPYEFIVNPQAQQSKKPIFGGNKFYMKIGVLVGGAIVVMIVIAVVISAFAPKGSASGMTALVQRQQEIYRVAKLNSGFTGQDTKNFVTNVWVTLSSQQAQATGYLTTHGTKLSNKVLALDMDSQTDALLTNAQATNTLDKATVQVLSSELSTYQALIKTTFNATSSKTLKAQLSQDYTAVGLLQAEAKAVNFNGS